MAAPVLQKNLLGNKFTPQRMQEGEGWVKPLTAVVAGWFKERKNQHS